MRIDITEHVKMRLASRYNLTQKQIDEALELFGYAHIGEHCSAGNFDVDDIASGINWRYRNEFMNKDSK